MPERVTCSIGAMLCIQASSQNRNNRTRIESGACTSRVHVQETGRGWIRCWAELSSYGRGVEERVLTVHARGEMNAMKRRRLALELTFSLAWFVHAIKP